jgi:hypothetical protein
MIVAMLAAVGASILILVVTGLFYHAGRREGVKEIDIILKKKLRRWRVSPVREEIAREYDLD